MRKCISVVLSALLALGPTSVAIAAPAAGTVSGQVTLEGQPLAGIGVALVDLDSGQIHRARSDNGGRYQMQVAAGQYAVTSSSVAGLAVGKAPAVVDVAPGRVAVASLDLMRVSVVDPSQGPVPQGAPAPTGPQTYGNITHEPVGCMVAGQFPLLDAVIDQPDSVARARVYFKSSLSPEYYYVEMTRGQAEQVAQFFGKLPKPKLDATPITYYVQTMTTDFKESQTPEIQAIVVADESECPQGLKVAPVGPPGAVTVFSAGTAVVVVPVGFATAGLAIGGAVLIGALIAAALTTAVVVAAGDESPSPSPSPVVPSPSPSPAASPSPSPAASPSPFVCRLCDDTGVDGIPDTCPCNHNLPKQSTCGVSGTPPFGYKLQSCQMTGQPFTFGCGNGLVAAAVCPEK